MKISYAILTHNEGQYIDTLLSFLTTNKRPEDEIVIVDDFSTDLETIEILKKFLLKTKRNYLLILTLLLFICNHN